MNQHRNKDCFIKPEMMELMKCFTEVQSLVRNDFKLLYHPNKGHLLGGWKREIMFKE